MDPSVLRRWITSKVMSRMASEARQLKVHVKAEAQRAKRRAPHTIEYFHQVDDGYSHLAAQVLPRLAQRYQVELICHLVDGPLGANAPEPDLLLKLSRYDSHLVAQHYGLEFGHHLNPPESSLVEHATNVLAALNDAEFVRYAAEVGEAMWNTDAQRLSALGANLGELSSSQSAARIALGNKRRADLQHYSGGMFYYGGEWYWGVDRLYHLEQRLASLGLDSTPDDPLIVPRPAIATGPLKDDGRLTLEIYPSLRSPYSAIAFDQTVALAKAVGVTLVVRPVLPMVMRGVPATNEKGRYIFFDAGREARAAGVPFGPCADPIGQPTRRAYSLLAFAEQQGKLVEFLASFLRCAWVDAVNTNNDRGMRMAVERAGLDWQEAQHHIGQPGWEDALEANRIEMYNMGLWGVPSYRLLDEHGQALVQIWGQDRLWLVAREMQRALQKRI